MDAMVKMVKCPYALSSIPITQEEIPVALYSMAKDNW